MTRPTIYLAGGMEKAGPYGSIWRYEIEPDLESKGYSIWNPYREEIKLGIDVDRLADLKKTDFDLYRKYCEKIVTYDISKLKNCSCVAVRIDKSVLSGAGTYGELTFCKILGIPVYAWVDLPNGIYDIPSWAVGCITDFSYTKEGFYSIIPKVSHSLDTSYVDSWAEEFSDK